jgi:chorismate mutase/prephenate dehydratase
MDIEKMREKIDAIDKGLIELFEERFALSRDVANYKIKVGKNILDKEREKAKIKSVEALIKDQEDKGIIEELFGQIMDLSRKVQYRIIVENEDTPVDFEQIEEIPRTDIRVVYQGVPGAYSHEAMLQYFGEKTTSFGVEMFKDAMEAVFKEEADFAVLPIANSSAGIVSEIYDLLVEYECYIMDEIGLPVSMHFWGFTKQKFQILIRYIRILRHLHNAESSWKAIETGSVLHGKIQPQVQKR